MILGIHQPQFCPWLGYFDKINQSDAFVFLDDVQFKKNEWQNRNRIRTAQGEQWLTVPVIHHFGQTIKEVEINNNTKWRQNHVKAIQQNYAKSPHFDQYFPSLQKLYEQEWGMLVEINMAFIKLFMEWLGITTPISLSSEHDIKSTKTERLVELCQVSKADTYLAGADGEKYMDFALFEAQNIAIMTQEFEHPTYQQLWTKTPEDFISHMCILDLLFNHGEESLAVISRKESRAS